ncbi:DedA family protein [Nocardioides sp. KR10-350]|uniref:DedA family protein n=1 Tax=Nocardioides cheoyonin TaxID=3156615 RepID=UPI0032B5CF19
MNLAEHLLALPPWLVLGAAFLLPALESSAFVGFVFPGETALVVGGVLAGQGRLPAVAVLVLGVLGAVLGDTVGYAVGRRAGPVLLASSRSGRLARVLPSRYLERALDLVRRRGASAVFLGRWTAALRVVVPGVAGMSGVRYRTFAIANLAGGVAWVSTVVAAGILAGRNWQHVVHLFSLGGLAVLAALVAAVVALRWTRRRSHRPRAVASLPPWPSSASR